MLIKNDFNNQTLSTSPPVSETNITPAKTHTHPASVCADIGSPQNSALINTPQMTYVEFAAIPLAQPIRLLVAYHIRYEKPAIMPAPLNRLIPNGISMIFLSIERLPVITTANISPPRYAFTQRDSYVRIHISHSIIKKERLHSPSKTLLNISRSSGFIKRTMTLELTEIFPNNV